MKKHLIAGAALAALIGASASAQDANLSVNLDGSVPTQCAVFMFSGLAGAESTSVDPSNDVGPRGGGGTWSTDATLDIGLGDLESEASYTLGSLASVCNTANAIVTIGTSNGFALENGGSSIGFSLAVSGSSLSGGFDTESSYVAGGANQPNGNTRTLSMELDAFDPLSQAPGSYADSILVTVAPQV